MKQLLVALFACALVAYAVNDVVKTRPVFRQIEAYLLEERTLGVDRTQEIQALCPKTGIRGCTAAQMRQLYAIANRNR